MSTNHRIFLLLVAIIFAFTSCSNPQRKTISRKEMTNFLIDLHQLDGALIAKNMGQVEDRNNIYYYNALLNKHNITKAQFDSTLSYYAKNPKKFERIYSDVIEKLTQKETDVKAGVYHPIDYVALRNSTENLWPLTSIQFRFSKDSTPTKLRFVVKNRQLAWKDQYKLTFLHQVGKTDKAKNKQAVIRIHYKDKKTDSIVCNTISDSLLRRYTITIDARRKNSIDSITGALINYNPVKGKFIAMIDSIKLTRKFDAVAQDSIQKAIQSIENPAPEIPGLKQTLRIRSKIILQRGNEKPE